MPTGPRLLDTVTLSEVIKGRDAGVLARAQGYLTGHGHFLFSIITRYEILRGLKAKNALRQVERFEDQCRASTVLPLTDEIVIQAAEIYAALHQRGALIEDADILIAATALVNGLPLVTESVSTSLRLGKVVGRRIRLIQDSARLSGARQPYLAPRKPGGQRDRLICRKTSLTGEKPGLSMARQAYPQPADGQWRPDKLICGKTTLSGSRTRLSAAG